MIKSALLIASILWFTGCGQQTHISSGATNSSLKIPLTAVGGGYLMDLWVGQKAYSVLIDTGSSNLILVGDAQICPDCGYGKSGYTPGETSALLGSGQTYGIQYGIGYGNFELFQENVGLTQSSTVPYDLGVFVSGSQVMNVLGLAYADLAAGPSDAKPFWDQFQSANRLNDIFSINLCPSTSKNSFIEFGTTDLSLNPSYTSILPLPLKSGSKFEYYVVQPTRLKIDANTSVAFPAFKDQAFVIVDSGTTQIMLSSDMLKVLQDYYAAAPYNIDPSFWDNSPSSAATTITAAEYASLKPLSIEFPDMNNGSFTVSISPSTYTQAGQDAQNRTVYTANMANAGDLSNSNVTTLILGNKFMQNAYVVFDRANSRIGFASNAGLCS